MPSPWTKKRANDWYRDTGWLVGCNYSPRNAINQLEMWQADTFSPDVIDEELRWAKSLGFNSLRIFLHDLVWQQDSKKYLKRIDKVLAIAKRHGIGAMLVFFDSVWHPFPWAGKQREPEPGVHNSGWAQSPGLAVLRDEKRFDALEEYVVGVVRAFKDDARVQIWDVWNEPDNPNAMSYGPRDVGGEKADLAAKYLPRVFDWVRSAKPSQPLTCGVWAGDWSSESTLKPHERVSIEQSDLISFHSYWTAEKTEEVIKQLQQFGRPIFCTEYMSRGSGSTFETVLPMLKRNNVSAYNWGFVAGKTQTNYPWDSWQRPYEKEPDPWFHEIFRADGSPYRQAEVDAIRSVTGAAAPRATSPGSGSKKSSGKKPVKNRKGRSR